MDYLIVRLFSPLFLLQLTFAWITCFAHLASAQSSSSASPLTLPKVIKLREAMQRPCGATFSNSTTYLAINELSQAFEFSFWLDRRIDPNRSLSIQPSSGRNVEQVLEAIAAQSGGGIAWIEEVIYIGPMNEVESIETAYWNLYQQYPAKARQAKSSMEWARKSIPLVLIQSLAESQKLKIEGEELLEYDVWRAGKLECSIPARWSLLLGGFGLTSRLDVENRTMEIVPLPEAKLVTAKYAASKISSRDVERWKEKWPKAKIKGGNKDDWTVQASPAAHRDLILPIREVKPQGNGTKEEKVSGRIEGRLVDIMPYFVNKYQLQMQPPTLPKEWGERVAKVDAKNWTLAELLQRLGDAIQLKIRLNGNTIEISE